MKIGWVVWRTKHGLTVAHYVGATGVAPLCGWAGKEGVPAGLRADDRIAAPADSTRCRTCDRLVKAPA